jgi:hypothetical protein
MFAFGRTIGCVEGACDPLDEVGAVRAAAIISSLTAQTHTARLCAADTVGHNFFDPAKECFKAQAAECTMCLSTSCPCGLINANMGVACSLGQHFLCLPCLESLVAQAIQHCSDSNTAHLSRLSDGRIHCPHCLAQQPRAICDYADSQLAKALPATAFDSYLHARIQLLEDSKTCELEEEMQQKLKQASICVLCGSR